MAVEKILLGNKVCGALVIQRQSGVGAANICNDAQASAAHETGRIFRMLVEPGRPMTSPLVSRIESPLLR